MAIQMLEETPPEANDPVTLIYFHNHFRQLSNWLNSLRYKHPDFKGEFDEAETKLEEVQAIIRSIHEKESK